MQSRGTKWTEEQTELLRKLHAEKLSCAMIASRMGCGFTRNAIIGRLHRLGLSNAMSRIHKEKPRSLKKRPVKRENRKSIRIVRANGNSDRMRVMETAITDLDALRCVEVIPRAVDLLDLKASECRYPYGEGPFTFCGHACVEGLSYCPPHAALVRTAPRPLSEAGREQRRRTLRAIFRLTPMGDAA